MSIKKLAKCKRAVKDLRSGAGTFVAAEKTCDEARQAGASPKTITAIWSQGLPGGLGVIQREGYRDDVRQGGASGRDATRVIREMRERVQIAMDDGDAEKSAKLLKVLQQLEWERDYDIEQRDAARRGTSSLEGVGSWTQWGPGPGWTANDHDELARGGNTTAAQRNKYEWVVMDERSGSAQPVYFTNRHTAEAWNHRWNAGHVRRNQRPAGAELGSTERGRAKQKRYSAPRDTRRAEHAKDDRIADLYAENRLIELQKQEAYVRAHPDHTMDSALKRIARERANLEARLLAPGWHFGGLGHPSEDHWELREMANDAAYGSLQMFKEALRAGDCGVAFETLLALTEMRALTSAHGNSMDKPAPATGHGDILELTQRFQQKCIR